MASLIYLDTHVVAWLYAGDLSRISAQGAALIRENTLRISPTVVLELQDLYEIERVRTPAPEVVSTLRRAIGLGLCERPFSSVVEHAAPLTWARDPFDRLIVGQADIGQNRLLTKDELIRDHYPHAVW
jgi:PIN domain nuclease of toxin-antitoxin system